MADKRVDDFRAVTRGTFVADARDMHLGYSESMQQAMIPTEMLEQRRRLGLDKHDEVWEGIYHLVSSPTPSHQRIQGELFIALQAFAKRGGFKLYTDLDLHDPTAQPDRDYRQPDLSVVRVEYVTPRGIKGPAELAIEVISPHDESRIKVPFYARIGVRETWLVDPLAHTIDIFAGGNPIQRSTLGLDLTIENGNLVIRDGADTHVIELGDAP
jgi:Uma2 family endonuclease